MADMNDKWSFSDKLAVALACLAGLMTLILFWTDRTPVAAEITIGAMVLLMAYPVLHFVHSWIARTPVFAVVSHVVQSSTVMAIYKTASL